MSTLQEHSSVPREDAVNHDLQRAARLLSRAGVASWAAQLGTPGPEAPRSRRMAHIGGIAAIGSLVIYLTWRVAFTLPAGGWNLTVALVLVTFEALPLGGLILKAVTLWNIDGGAPPPVIEAPPGAGRL